MKTFTNISFVGHWPVGTAAVVHAEDERQAASLLETALEKAGLPQKIDPAMMVEIPQGECAVILADGNY